MNVHYKDYLRQWRLWLSLLTNTTSRDMLDHLFLSYGSITAVDIEQNFENMQNAWDPQQPVETLFKQIQDCVYFAEARGIAIGAAQKLSSAYSKIFKSGKFNSACCRWDEKLEGGKLGTISRFTLLLPIAIIGKCKEKQLEPKHSPTPPLLKPVKMTWPNKNLGHLLIWQQLKLLTEMWLQN
jgi:hypothetical protein